MLSLGPDCVEGSRGLSQSGVLMDVAAALIFPLSRDGGEMPRTDIIDSWQGAHLLQADYGQINWALLLSRGILYL